MFKTAANDQISLNEIGSQYNLAPFATNPQNSRGRFHNEENSTFRNVFQRDRNRIIHSAAFRRLEYKTQVFVNHEGDHYRTRLTHSLEVSQVARSISRKLGACEDLAEVIALAHDLGHGPFGHAGEDQLNEIMKPYGGFNHNHHTLKIVTKLEQRYASFDGLNLTYETLEGITKHNGPIGAKEQWGYIKEHNQLFDLELATYPTIEAQIAAISDDIAYNNHDIEDGLRAGLFDIDELKTISFIADIYELNAQKYPNASQMRLINETIRVVIDQMISDVVNQTKHIITTKNINSVDDIRNAGCLIVKFSPQMEEQHQQIKAFLHTKMYRHFKVNRMTSKAKRVIDDLFNIYFHEPGCLPLLWQQQTTDKSDYEKAHIVADFIAGMTDRFAMKEHRHLFDLGTID